MNCININPKVIAFGSLFKKSMMFEEARMKLEILFFKYFKPASTFFLC